MPAPINKKINRRYTDIDMDLLVHPHTNDIVGRYDTSAINGALQNIVKTKKGERVFNPDFGSHVYKSLFEPMSSVTRITLEAQIENAVTTQEPRINLQQVSVKANADQNRYEVSIFYTPINETEIVQLDFFLNRLR
ncbi:MAG: GPW/gp25 family protein [Candidatus Brocadiales bacterium]|nr:GPW/gp25 family protein [Candidatus Brocadiales bacterium]